MLCDSCGYALWNLSSPVCPECGAGFDVRDYWFQPGTVAFACPHCGHLHEGCGEQYIPASAPTMNCAACGQQIDVPSMRVVVLCDNPEDAEAYPRQHIPWERRRQIGRWKAWRHTAALCMAAPSKLGQRLSRNSRWADAYWFAVVAHLVPYAVAAVISVSILCYYMLMGSNTVSVEPTMVALLVLLYVGMAFVAPLLITGLWAGMTHLILLMGGAPRHGFHVTSSALLYGHAPIVFYLLGMVPLVGVFVSLALYVWVMVIASVVLMRAQRVSGWRATLAVVLPPIVLIGGCLGLLIMSMI